MFFPILMFKARLSKTLVLYLHDIIHYAVAKWLVYQTCECTGVQFLFIKWMVIKYQNRAFIYSIILPQVMTWDSTVNNIFSKPLLSQLYSSHPLPTPPMFMRPLLTREHEGFLWNMCKQPPYVFLLLLILQSTPELLTPFDKETWIKA